VTSKQDVGEDTARALHQVVSMPEVENMRFDGDPIKYVLLLHRFETCPKKGTPDNLRRLQLLIQHCFGQAKDANKSCLNLPVHCNVAKSTLCENFGLPHRKLNTSENWRTYAP